MVRAKWLDSLPEQLERPRALQGLPQGPSAHSAMMGRPPPLRGRQKCRHCSTASASDVRLSWPDSG
eukprot:10183366-Lingulodinium_polyedra.AAC.1